MIICSRSLWKNPRQNHRTDMVLMLEWHLFGLMCVCLHGLVGLMRICFDKVGGHHGFLFGDNLDADKILEVFFSFLMLNIVSRDVVEVVVSLTAWSSLGHGFCLVRCTLQLTRWNYMKVTE